MIRDRHDTLTQSLHWIVAVLVVATYVLGIAREDLPRGEFRSALLSLHMSLGVSVWALTVLRLAWRPFAPRVAPVEMPSLLQSAAAVGHVALYAALLAVPLTGLLSVWTRGRSVAIFGMLSLPSPWVGDRGLSRLFEEIHETAGTAIIVLAGLHAAAAILHHVVLRDQTLVRMLPFVRRRTTA